MAWVLLRRWLMQLSRPTLLFALATPLLQLTGCLGGYADPSREFAEPVPDGPAHPVTIHQPQTLGVVDTELTDVHGTPIGVACATCHGSAAKPGLVESEGNPEEFHGTLEVVHGNQPCAACHDPNDRSLLRLADGSTLEMTDAMQLCAQCHGPQHRDYQAGSHGGMTGHWDLRQGPRERNHCIDCHDAHAPAFQGGQPVARAVDRSRSPTPAHAEGSH